MKPVKILGILNLRKSHQKKQFGLLLNLKLRLEPEAKTIQNSSG